MNLELISVIVIAAFAGITAWAWLDIRKMIRAYAAAGEAVVDGTNKIADAVAEHIPEVMDALENAAEEFAKRKEEEESDEEED